MQRQWLCDLDDTSDVDRQRAGLTNYEDCCISGDNGNVDENSAKEG